MKLNNKGMSLLELLVTIVMIGIVLVFLFQLLIDLRNERDNNNYAYDNQVNRADVMHTVERDLNRYQLVGVNKKNSNNISVEFIYNIGNKEVKTLLTTEKVTNNDEDKYYISYTNADGENFYWEMIGAKIDPCAKFYYNVETDDNGSNSLYFRLNIYLYNAINHPRNNEENNNALDDIEISYFGRKNDEFLRRMNEFNLTNGNAEVKDVGNCS